MRTIKTVLLLIVFALCLRAQVSVGSLSATASSNWLFVTLTSSTANPATTGVLRFASADTIAWRNNANNANITLSKDASDNFTLGSAFFANSITSLGNTTTAAAGVFRWSTTSSQISAPANGQVQCQNNAAAPCQFIANSVVSKGTTFTTSGCSVSATTGGGSAGIFTLGANNCTVVVTINGATGSTAPNGWACSVDDRTAPTILISQSTSNATTASFSIPITAGATDVIQFFCIGY